MPRLAARAGRDGSLVQQPGLVTDLLCGLSDYAGESFSRYLERPSSDSTAISAALHELWIEGVWLPRMAGSQCRNEAVRKAVLRVLASEEVRSLTYRDLFELSRPLSRALIAIINRAFKSGLIFTGPGYSCCQPKQGGGTECVECQQSSFCAMIIGQNQCTQTSQNCPQ